MIIKILFLEKITGQKNVLHFTHAQLNMFS